MTRMAKAKLRLDYVGDGDCEFAYSELIEKTSGKFLENMEVTIEFLKAAVSGRK